MKNAPAQQCLFELEHALTQFDNLRFKALKMVRIHRRQLYRNRGSISTCLLHPILRWKGRPGVAEFKTGSGTLVGKAAGGV